MGSNSAIPQEYSVATVSFGNEKAVVMLAIQSHAENSSESGIRKGRGSGLTIGVSPDRSPAPIPGNNSSRMVKCESLSTLRSTLTRLKCSIEPEAHSGRYAVIQLEGVGSG